MNSISKFSVDDNYKNNRTSSVIFPPPKTSPKFNRKFKINKTLNICTKNQSSDIFKKLYEKSSAMFEKLAETERKYEEGERMKKRIKTTILKHPYETKSNHQDNNNYDYSKKKDKKTEINDMKFHYYISNKFGINKSPKNDFYLVEPYTSLTQTNIEKYKSFYNIFNRIYNLLENPSQNDNSSYHKKDGKTENSDNNQYSIRNVKEKDLNGKEKNMQLIR